MNKKILSPRFIFVVTVIAIAAIYRIIPHIPNFTPIAAMALFGGTYINRKVLAFIIPMAAMIISDLVIGLHGTMLAVYVSFAISVGIGILIRKKVNIFSVILASVASSVIFFFITNIAVWYTGMVGYPMNIAGLISCFTAALAFFRTELFGTLIFNSVFFGSLFYAEKRFPILAHV